MHWVTTIPLTNCLNASMFVLWLLLDNHGGHNNNHHNIKDNNAAKDTGTEPTIHDMRHAHTHTSPHSQTQYTLHTSSGDSTLVQRIREDMFLVAAANVFL